MNITWQTQSRLLYDSLKNGELSSQANGGNSYDFQAFQALNDNNKQLIDESVVRKQEGFAKYWARLLMHRVESDVVIKDPRAMTLSALSKKSKQVCVLHHIDFELQKSSLFYKWYFARMMKRFKMMDTVVVVSAYWESKLRELGVTRIKRIYNSFDPGRFVFTDLDISSFKEKYKLDTAKPIIYIGNAKKGKGAEEAYEALKESNYTLVMSGPKNNAVELPIVHLDLEYDGYLKLIAAADVVLTMSTMIEGWNRTAHEALLSGTPVIGSGIAGMKELLSGAGQIIEKDYANLPQQIERCLENKESLLKAGNTFVAQFNSQYFRDSWLQLIADVTKQ